LKPHDSSPLIWLILAAAGLILLVMLLPPIPQPAAYHAFADQRGCFALAGLSGLGGLSGWPEGASLLPNCLDTLSNALFIVVGLIGLRFLSSPAGRQAFSDAREPLPYIVFFIGVMLIGFASAYYHLAPDHARLSWDRGAMALAMMAWFSAILGERLNVALARKLLPFLIAAGLSSVAWWLWSETEGQGDLRPYLLMQAAPMLLIPLLLWRSLPRYSRSRDIMVVIGLYGLALLLDYGDKVVFSATAGMVSGHTLKHVVAALAVLAVVRHLKMRRALT
jgi:hypothetical protein